MALIVLAFGAAAASFAYLGSTSLLGAKRGEQRALDLYASDAGVEHALWRLRYESGFASSLASPATYNQTFNDRAVSITVASAAPSTSTTSPSTSTTQQSGSRINISATVSPATITPNLPTTFTYELFIQNNGTSRVHLDRIGDLLPAGFAYVSGSVSSTGIRRSGGDVVLGEPGITTTNGQEGLVWDFASPKPWVDAATTAVVTFHAAATPGEGTYLNEAWVEGNPDKIGVVSTGASSPVIAVWPEFTVASAAGVLTIRARARLLDTGLAILAWQVE